MQYNSQHALSNLSKYSLIQQFNTTYIMISNFDAEHI